MNANISRDEWLKALGEAVEPIDPDALTVREIAERFGIHRLMAYRRAQRLVAEGKAIRTFKRIPYMNGTRRVPAYKLVARKSKRAA